MRRFNLAGTMIHQCLDSHFGAKSVLQNLKYDRRQWKPKPTGVRWSETSQSSFASKKRWEDGNRPGSANKNIVSLCRVWPRFVGPKDMDGRQGWIMVRLLGGVNPIGGVSRRQKTPFPLKHSLLQVCLWWKPHAILPILPWCSVEMPSRSPSRATFFLGHEIRDGRGVLVCSSSSQRLQLFIPTHDTPNIQTFVSDVDSGQTTSPAGQARRTSPRDEKQ